jgi:hypothetical protein
MYQCHTCYFSSNIKSDYHKHLSTIKHTLNTPDMKTTFPNTLSLPGPGPITNIPLYSCPHCTKTYRSKNGLWHHSKACIPTTESCTLISEESTNSLTTKQIPELVEASYQETNMYVVFMIITAISVYIVVNGVLLYMLHNLA